MRRSSLRWTIPAFLGLQVAMLWLQGAQIHRQNQVLQGLREDIQALAEAMDFSHSAGEAGPDDQAVPSAFQASPAPKAEKQMAVLGAQEEQDAAAAKELQASRDSARKAISEARETQSKLSITENIKKAEEAKKVQAATNEWQRWVWGAMGLVVIALAARSLLRRRG
jgi:hypothetical protein